MPRKLIPFIVLLLACRVFSPGMQAELIPTSAAPTQTATRTVKPLPSATPTSTIAPTSTRTQPNLPTLTQTALPLTAAMFMVRFHPDGLLYIGDQISIEVIAPQNIDLSQRKVTVTVPVADGSQSFPVDFSAFGIAARNQATLMWAWNTLGLQPGEYSVSFDMQPSGPVWSQVVNLLPRAALPVPENGAVWAMAESDCCLAYYVTGTEAGRDLDQLLFMIDQQADSAALKLGTTIEEAIPIIFLPRVLGHGGFTSNEIAISYLDRNYAGSNAGIVIHHEIVHLLDARLGGELRPSILVEGLAVYLSGGHFKLEPLMPRAAALLAPEPGCLDVHAALAGVVSGSEVCGLSLYVSLEALVDEFYYAQHEVGYLQAAALVEYMVQNWGWQAFSNFYRDIHPPQPVAEEEQVTGGQQYQALDTALKAHFNLSLEELEGDFLDALRHEILTTPLTADVLVTVRFYDTVRRYQRLLDPSAYFLTAWLPDGGQMRERGIIADFMRRPSLPENIEIETSLIDTYQLVIHGDYRSALTSLDVINAILDRYEDLDQFPDS